MGFRTPLGPTLGRPGPFLEASWALFGRSLSPLDTLGALLKLLRGALGSHRDALRVHLGVPEGFQTPPEPFGNNFKTDFCMIWGPLWRVCASMLGSI